MARSFHLQGPHGLRPGALLSRRGAVTLLMILLAASVAALWMTGAPAESLLPIAPPA